MLLKLELICRHNWSLLWPIFLLMISICKLHSGLSVISCTIQLILTCCHRLTGLDGQEIQPYVIWNSLRALEGHYYSYFFNLVRAPTDFIPISVDNILQPLLGLPGPGKITYLFVLQFLFLLRENSYSHYITSSGLWKIMQNTHLHLYNIYTEPSAAL